METAWLTALVSSVVGAVSMTIGAISGRATRKVDVTDHLVAMAATAAENLTAENARLLRRLAALQDEIEELERRHDRMERYLRSLGLDPDSI
jgi:predicted RNase H-like nuclease (RuvC/YqgF family)